ncbi:MAG: phosphotransferase [Erysipelotrichaceae bacterium]
MNNYSIEEANILKEIKLFGFKNQRVLSNKMGISLGKVNKLLNNLIEKGYLNKNKQFTSMSESLFIDSTLKQAIILAAGCGLRMIPISSDTPKALLAVKDEVLIERLIKQCKAVGINNIKIVVGFKKEEFEYLMDEYGVDLIVNEEYGIKNNLKSLSLVDNLENTYVIPSDLYAYDNPFHSFELYPWYMLSNKLSENSDITYNHKYECNCISKSTKGNKMIGIAYFDKEIGIKIKKRLDKFVMDANYDNSFWEDAAKDNHHFMLYANIVDDHRFYEINTYEQLRIIDDLSIHLNSSVMEILCNTFKVDNDEIKNIEAIKKGMTNRSFKFNCKGINYIARVPGEGTQQLINRKEEYEVYQAISKIHISDEVKYFDPDTGLKITRFIENARNADAENLEDVKLCMRKLKAFHECNLKVNHTFNIFEKIDFYEKLWDGKQSVFKDYLITKQKITKLKNMIKYLPEKWTLCHIDSVPDNFMFTSNDIKLIDWEYAGMQDAYVDIAMFAIYSLYNKEQVDQLIEAYFEGNCPIDIRIKIYAYIAICGLLWSNWCEYKRFLGVEFGEYALRQYRYAKDYYLIVKEMMGEKFNELCS